jgi:ferredoxin-NADP reductase/predicted pyridoxine 5'-phosphate oxidase superfamily flavin-nucleotide-binding protein
MATEPEAGSSPWHAGESRLQQRLGVAERMAVFGRKVIRNYLPDQHRTFYGQLPFLLVGVVDAHGNPWATVLEGRPGFLSSPDPKALRISALPGPGDPAGAALGLGAAVGLLGIEPHTRRRNRLNGTVTAVDAGGFLVGVDQAFGNCPQYIQTRTLRFAHQPGQQTVLAAEHGQSLDDAARATIASADTFFIASYVDTGSSPAGRGVDVSHRGGKPGFIRIDGDLLTIPDFAGNLHFNTLGNLLLNPRAGLTFVDFTTGELLQLTGSTELVLEGDEVASFQGAERLWRLKVEQVVRRRSTLALRGTFGEYSPNSLLTGNWAEADGRRAAAALHRAWRPFRVARIHRESTSIVSFHLEAADDAGLPPYLAGQHLPIRLQLAANEPAVIRTYTLSAAPSDADFRISVKRDGAASTYLHDHVSVGDLLEARVPEGGFTVDAAERRPLVLISAGVGITPMLAMLRHVVYEGLRTRRMRQTWFLHSARTAAERPFDTELAALGKLGNGSIQVVRALSRPESSAVKGVDYDYQGRLSADLLEDVLPFGDFDFYLCGPGAFTQDLYDGLRALRVPDDRLHAEAFGPSTLRRSSDPGQAAMVTTLAPPSADPVQVVFAKSGKEARWLPGSGTLLELAEARGLTPEFSCRGGSCGTCRTPVLSGEFTYMVPPTAPVGAGESLICCATPAAGQGTDARLVLDL